MLPPISPLKTNRTTKPQQLGDRKSFVGKKGLKDTGIDVYPNSVNDRHTNNYTQPIQKKNKIPSDLLVSQNEINDLVSNKTNKYSSI